ncbi:MAG: hypothetical protein JXN64_07280 [Spirochaetes bacterium]|nr:hypothetical protein [Spirochaetota bacterium]
MQKKEKKLFKVAAILYMILIILIYFGSYLRYLLSNSWFGTGSVIVVIFIWVTIFFITTIITARGVFHIKQRLRATERLDFVAKLGALAVEIGKENEDGNMELSEFFELVCKENGVMDIPDLSKYANENFALRGTREKVFETLRHEIEAAANSWSKEKK